MKLLVFAGSTRQQLLATASWPKVGRAPWLGSAGAEVTHIELGDFDVPMYNADLEAEGTRPTS